MNELIESVERRQLRQLPDFRVGDRIRVHFQVIEGQRRRTQVFEGVVLKIQGPGARRTFTVRKLSFGVGVERTFPVHSPKIERIEVAARGEVRRAKLYYLRGRIGKRARVRESRDFRPEDVAMMPAPQAEAAQEPAPDGDVAPEAAEEAPGAEEVVEVQEEAGEAEPEAATVEPEEPQAAEEPSAEADASGGEDAAPEGEGATEGSEDSDSEEPAEGKQEGQPA